MQSDHWIITELHTRKDCLVHKSTYKDNPFLEKNIIKEIEALQKDPYLWKVYGLGELAPPEEIIYRYELIEEPKGELIGYGMDFGWVNPTAIVALYLEGEDLTIDEIFYQTGAPDQQLAEVLETLDNSVPIIADSSEPRTIDELNSIIGNRIEKAVKGSVVERIRKAKRYNLYVTKHSENVIFEMNNYRNMKVNGQILEKPVKKHDHAMDAFGYGLEVMDIQEIKVHDIW
jgi:phage terminase large subunit